LLGVIRTATDRTELEDAQTMADRAPLLADAEFLIARAVLEARLGSRETAGRMLNNLERQTTAEERRKAALAEVTWLQNAGETGASLALLQAPSIQNAFAAGQTPPEERSLLARQISVLAEAEQQVDLAATAARAVTMFGDQDGLSDSERLQWRIRAARLLREAGSSPRMILNALRDEPGHLPGQPPSATPEAWVEYLLLVAETAVRAREQDDVAEAIRQLEPSANASPRIALRVAQLQLVSGEPGDALATLRRWRVAGGARPPGIDQAGLLNLLLLRASAARAVGDRGEEVLSLQEAAAVDSRVGTTLDQAQRLVGIREHASALAVLQVAIPPAAQRLAGAAPPERNAYAEDLARLHIMRGEALRQAGEGAAALLAYQTSLALRESWPVRWVLADLLRQQGRRAEAMVEYARLAVEAPGQREAQLALLTLGDQQWAAGEQAAALASFEGALANGAGPPARLRAMEAATQLRQYALLLRLAEEAMRDPGFTALLTPAERNMWEARRCEALAALRRTRPAGCIPPSTPASRAAEERETALAEGYRLLALGQGEAASVQFEPVFQATGDTRAGLGLGEALLAVGRTGAALDLLARLVSRANVPAELEARITFAHGQALDQAGQPGRAAEAWERTLMLRPDTQLAIARLDALRRAGNVAQASRMADAMMVVGVEESARPRLEALRVRLALAQNDTDMARTQAEQLADRFPTPGHWALVSEARAAGGDRPGAADAAERALDGGASALARAGYAHLAAGDPARGADRLREALQRDPTLRPVRMDLAQVEVAAGQWSSARITLRDALAAARTAPGLPDAESRQQTAIIQALNVRATREFSAEVSTTVCAPSDTVGCRAAILAVNERLGSAGFGGATMAWSPHIEGVRNRELISLYARLLWANQPGTIQPLGRSFQGGVGISVRPFESVPFFLWAERSFGIGADSQDNWLLRASLGREWGTAWRADGSASLVQGWVPYASFYADVGHFLARQRDWLMVAEIRAGGTVQPGEAWRLIPYGLMRGEATSNPSGTSHAIMAGAALSLQRRHFYDASTGFLLTSEAFLRMLHDLDRSEGQNGSRVLFGLALRL
jgi:tetratricopeptide (TPR) repeat protein